MGIGGIAMGTLAAMLTEEGYHVTGSDQDLYPPMSTHLEKLKVPIYKGYRAQNLQQAAPGLVVIGNVIRRDNPEALYVLQHALPYLSMPQTIDKFFLNRHESMVVTGTHGKSTTASLLAWVLTHAQMEPSAFIGAFVNDWQRSYRIGNGKFMVIEGDEYDTAFFDKGPKFLHYRPSIGIITSIEYDHADIFPNFEAVLEAFRSFVHLFPSNGHLIVNADDPNCLTLARECKGSVITYGRTSHADWRILDVDHRPGEIHFHYKDPMSNHNYMITKLAGHHNLSNTMAVIAAASLAGLTPERIQEAVLAFNGVARRQQIIGESQGILIIDDFAHHPTAVKETVTALKLHFPDRRIIAVFEPRTNSSRRRVFQSAYAKSFDDALCVCLKEPPGMDSIPPAERLDTRQLARDIRLQNKEARYFEDTEDLLNFLLSYCRKGDLVLCMSNGSFDGLPIRLFDAIQAKS